MFLLKIFLPALLFVLSNCADNPFSTQPVLITTRLDQENNYRLPNNTRPVHYDVALVTNIHEDDFEFSGRVIITLKALEDTNNITIHYRQLTINDYKLIDSETENEINVKDAIYDEITEHFVFDMESPLKNDSQYQLTINYNGTLRDDLAGFHKSSYLDENGKRIWQAGTHFEPHNARHAFPCYDEPAIRTTFDISITHGKNYHAVSNMPVKSISNEADDMITTTFDTTPDIQTYLIAFVVSDFASISLQKIDGIPHTLYAKPEAIRNNQGDFGLFAGERILTNQEKYFQTKFSLPKMSQIAMPNFGAGAMENWGIVIYMQSLLLFDETSEDINGKHSVGHIIGHEFAHQWFGDLVAPKWWNYLWLNEGFATLYAAHTMSLVFPEYRDIDLFIINNLQHAMRVDETGLTRPMTFYVENHRGISSLFDDISYSKAGSVLRMFQHSLTEETWKKGLKFYLDDMQYKAADSDDLARNLQEAADDDNRLPEHITMKDVIDSWSLKGGYPIINVTRSSENVLLITQMKYINTHKRAIDDDLWIIPLNFATESHPNFTHTAPLVWMTSQNISIKNDSFNGFTENDWIIFNIQQTGYFRVNYDEELWHLIAEKLSSDTFEDIHVINRAQIIDDVLNLARGEFITYEIVFKILEYLDGEQDFLPWSSANNGLGYINRLMTGSANYQNFQRFIAQIIGPLYKELGSHDRGTKDNLSDKHARIIAINWACISGERNCLNDTTSRVQEVLEDPSAEIEANVRATIYCNGLRHGNRNDFDRMWMRFNITNDATTRRTLISGMGCMQDSLIQMHNLRMTLYEDNTYTRAERPRVLQAVYNTGGLSGVESSIKFIDENYDIIDGLYGDNAIRNNLYSMADKVTTKVLVDKFENLIDKLIEENVLESDEKDALMEKPNINLEWVANNNDEIGRYFKDYFGNGAEGSVISSVLIFFGIIFNIYVHV